MKYIDADKLKRFEEMLADIIVSSQGLCTYEACKDAAKSEAPALIGSLQQEQQEADLEKEGPKELDEMIDDYFKSLFPNIAYYRWRTSGVYVHASPDGIRFLCDHFYELGKNSK